ncbi:hypothetical protein AUP68_15585 [Ilyonectria robusta]
MDDFPPSVAGFRSPAPARDDASMSSDGLPPPENPNEILTVAPKERFRLGYFDVMCLVMNRMIGKSSRGVLGIVAWKRGRDSFCLGYEQREESGRREIDVDDEAIEVAKLTLDLCLGRA